MAEKKSAACCGRIVAHKVNGDPYPHTCDSPTVAERTATRKMDTYVRANHRPTFPVRNLLSNPQPSPVRTDDVPPSFPASYESECDTCGDAMYEGDQIRSDGDGGWECASHADEREEQESRPCVHNFTWGDDGKGHRGSFCTHCGVPDSGELKAERVNRRAAPVDVDENDRPITGPLVDAANAFLGVGTPAAQPSAADMDADAFLMDDGGSAPETPEFNVSGQPAARYEWRGRTNMGYLTKDPRTGDFRRYKNGKPKGFTRATTFNKAASDSNALSDWGKRNVLIGASLRPDLVAKAHGLNHEDDKGALMSLVNELETAAGAKVSAQVGTDIHELTERWDGGQLTDLADVPAQYRGPLKLYLAALKEYGLRPVPGLIERTVFIPEFGGVVGTFDRVYLHEQSGQYIIGDVKTGKTLKYGMDEIETQEWTYAHGINLYGVYDWNTDEWETPEMAVTGHHGGTSDRLTVSEEIGVVIHLPVQGDDRGTCNVVKADLQRGRRHAQVCHDVRTDRANKPKPEPFTGVPAGPLSHDVRPTAPKPARSDVATSGDGSWQEPAPVPAATLLRSFRHQFSTAGSRQDLKDAYRDAKAGGVTDKGLAALVAVGKQRLAELGNPD